MRIIAFSDIHGNYKIISECLASESDVDLIAIAGDLTTKGSEEEASEAVSLIRTFSAPIVAVAGNMDYPSIENVFDQDGIGLNGKGMMVHDIGLCGVSGAPISPLRTPYEISEDEIFMKLEKGWGDIASARIKIILAHAPPHATKVDRTFLGIHAGSKALRKFTEAHQPDLILCGHIHEAAGQDVIGRTIIVNCGQASKGRYCIVDVGDRISIHPKQLKNLLGTDPR
jgi:Icc-related predicted phosphoesterase